MSSSRGPGGRGGGTQSAGTLHPPAVLDALPGRRLFLLLLLLPLLLPVWGGLRAGPAPCPVLLARRSPRELTSPGYPEPRGAPRDLAADLRAPRGWAVRLVFLDFDLGDSPGCAGDWVTVSADGNRTDAARLCGPPGSGPREFVSAGRTLTLRFHAGPPTPRGHRGFRALYHAVPAGNTTAVLEPGANASSRSPRGCPGPRNQTQAAVACGRPVTPLAPVPPTPGPRDAEPGSFPWQALTSIHGRAGGALLGDRWVLTAAHTLRPKNAAVGAPGRRRPRVDVYLGHADVDAMLASGPLEVRRVHVHPDYRPDEPHDFRGDLALLELRRPAPLGPHLLPVCLPAPGSPLRPGAAGYVSGFGARRGWLGTRLRASGVTVAPRDRCRAWLWGRGRPEALAPGMLCARDPGVCRGDSGGALVVWDDSAQHWVAAGVVSWGVGCGDGYGFYTDVLSYADWIRGVMEGRG